MHYNIKDYGAVGDKENLDSPAVQRAIDECSKQGGGTVYCPAGTYLIGTIILKKNVNLYLDTGALLLGSINKKDYKVSKDGKSYLIYAKHAGNICLSGYGTIDGNGKCFFIDSPEKSHKQPASWRPRALVHFVFCKNVTIENLTLQNSPCYTLWPLACDFVKITGIKIFCDPRGPNTDGIDIDCCKDVIIDNCYVECGDDAIAVKSDSGRIGIDRNCENLVVSNCILSSTCSGIRLGYEGNGIIKNCVFNNIIIKRTWLGIDFLVVHKYDGNEFFIEHGSRIEDISFHNMQIESERPIHLWVGDDSQIDASIKNIKFSNICLKGKSGIAIYGARNNRIKNISFKNIELEFYGEMDLSLAQVPYPTSCWGPNRGKSGLPYGVFCRYADDLEFRNVKLSWHDASGDWLNPVKLVNASNINFIDLQVIANNADIIEKENSSEIHVINSFK